MATVLNVSLTPELDQFVRDRVATGRNQTASEVIQEGLRLLEHQEQDRDMAFDSLKAKLERGAAQADRGELLNPHEVFKQIDALKCQRAAAKM